MMTISTDTHTPISTIIVTLTAKLAQRAESTPPTNYRNRIISKIIEFAIITLLPPKHVRLVYPNH